MAGEIYGYPSKGTPVGADKVIGTDSADQSTKNFALSAFWDRAKHTGTQLAATISDFAASADARADLRIVAASPARNLAVNGGLEVWQRGVGPFTANGAYTADQWYITLSGTSTVSVAKETVTVDPNGSGASLKATYTHVAGGALTLRQNVEDYLGLRGRTVTVSARIYATTAGAVLLALVDSAGSTYSAYHGGTGWETVTVTRALGTAIASLRLSVEAYATATFYLDSVMFVSGATALAFVPLHPQEDLARCQRYYEVLGFPGAGDLIVSGTASAVSQYARANATFRQVKGGTPTVTKVGTWGVANTATTQPTIGATTSHGFRYEITSLAAGDFYAYNNNAGNCITVEWNPA